MATSETALCNQALARIGAKRINDLDTDQSVNAGHCREHYTQTRDALLRSHWWRFALDRKALSQDTNDPDFEWDNQFFLPNDFFRLHSLFGDDNTRNRNVYRTFAIEGDKILTNESSVNMRYVKKVEDTAKFDPLFTEVLVLQLAVKLIMPISQNSKTLELLLRQLVPLMATVRTVDKSETQNIGRAGLRPWNDARRTRSVRSDTR